MSPAIARPTPYQGLNRFDERDASYFFGREKDARLIAADLFAAPVTVLYGASGVGKSSVLRAGVVPLLRPRSDLLIVFFGAWQTDPLRGLKSAVVEAIAALDGAPVDDRARQEIRHAVSSPLPVFLSSCAKLSKRRLMIVLDQFEEYFLYHLQDDEFGRQFPAATTLGDLSASFLLSMREESVSRLDRFEGRIPSLFDNYRRIDHLDLAAGRAAIERPLARFNEDFAATEGAVMSIEPMLIDQVLRDVRSGRVQLGEGGRAVTAETVAGSARIEAPYLQLVMTRIWNEERRERSTVLRSETLQRLGGAERIVQTHLDDVMARLGSDEQDIAARVFQLLVTPSGTKIAYTARDLGLTAGVDLTVLATILEKLSSGSDRILRPVGAMPDQAGDPRYEIFHDRLANAVLAWRARYLREKELAEVKRLEAERLASVTLQEDLKVGPPLKVRPRAPRVDPPYALIADLFRSGRLSLFVGAGVSISERPDRAWKPGDPFVPSSWELTQLLARDVQFPIDDRDAPSLPDVASYYSMLLGNKPLTNRLSEIFKPTAEPTSTHRLIALIARRWPLTILSTTFDTLTEQACDEAGVPYTLLVNGTFRGRADLIGMTRPGGRMEAIAPNEISLDDDMTWICKLFGSVDRDDPTSSNFIVTEEDEMDLFTRIVARQFPPPAISDRLSRSHTLFLGMGLRSWSQRLLLTSLANQRWRDERGWSICRGVSTVDAKRWARAGVDVFDMDVREFTASLQPQLEL